MLRACIMVLVLLVVMAYLSLFLAWNARPQPITTWQLGSQYTQELPVGLLFILGVLVGAVAMAVALMSPWSALKASESQQRSLVDKARAKLKAQDAKIRRLEEGTSVAAPIARPAATDVETSLSPTEAAALAAVAPAQEGPAAEKAKPPDEDPEVI